MAQGEAARQPPDAPEIERRVLLTRLQAVGLPVLALIPILALAGVFGLERNQRASQGGVLELEVKYPGRARFRSSGSLAIEVRNRLDRPVEGVTVLVDRSYVEAFEQVTFSPSSDELTETNYAIAIGRLEKGATRAVTADLRPRKYWLHRGIVAVSAAGVDTIDIDFSTFVFP